MPRTFVWEPQLPSAVVNAASWRLATELVAGLPGARVAQEHNGGGQYDELVIFTEDERVRLSINRNGSLHVLAAPHEIAPTDLWPDACRPGAAETTAKNVLRSAGLAANPRNRSGARLGYQVLAHILTARCLDGTSWDAVHLGADDSIHQPTTDELAAPAGQTWALTADDTVVAWFWEGWVVWPGGERLDLTRSRADGVSLAELAGAITRRRPPSTAAPLQELAPTVPGSEDPTAWLRFAGRYNAYERLAAEPHELEKLLEPVRREYLANRAVPRWCRPDLLRAWLFLLYRMDHFDGGMLFHVPEHEPTVEFEAVTHAWSVRTRSVENR